MRSENIIESSVSTVGNVSLSNYRCKRRAIRKRLKRQKKLSGKLRVDLTKLAKSAISREVHLRNVDLNACAGSAVSRGCKVMNYGRALISRDGSATRIRAIGAVICANLRGTVRISLSER